MPLNSIITHKNETASKHITESGSNANGQYVRFDDGTQICWRQRVDVGTSPTQTTLGDLSGYQHLEVWAYPAKFASIPAVSGSAFLKKGGFAVRFNAMNTQTVTTTSAPICHWSPGQFDELTREGVVAIGRWK